MSSRLIHVQASICQEFNPEKFLPRTGLSAVSFVLHDLQSESFEKSYNFLRFDLSNIYNCHLRAVQI